MDWQASRADWILAWAFGGLVVVSMPFGEIQWRAPALFWLTSHPCQCLSV